MEMLICTLLGCLILSLYLAKRLVMIYENIIDRQQDREERLISLLRMDRNLPASQEVTKKVHILQVQKK